MTAVATIVAAGFAPPNSNEWARIAVRATPGEDVAIGALHDSKYMARALVRHDGLCSSMGQVV